MNSDSLLRTLDSMKKMRSQAERKDVIQGLLKNPMARKVCWLALDAQCRFHIAKPFHAREGERQWDDSVFDLLDKLSSREITGGSAKQAVQECLTGMTTASQQLLWRVLRKDLRCGAGPKTFCSVEKDFVLEFEMQTCEAFDAGSVIQWPLMGEVKYDGVRVACLWDQQSVTIVSRNGLPLPGYDAFAEELSRRLDVVHQLTPLPPMVLDGEMDSAEGFYNTVGGARRLSGEHEYILRLVDVVPLHEGRPKPVFKVPQRVRFELREQLCDLLGWDGVTLPEGRWVWSEDDVLTLYEEVRRLDEEGLILKDPEAPYFAKRGSHWTKLKPKETADVEIFDFEEGTGENASRLGAVWVWFGDVPTKVGIGWSVELREAIWADKEAYRGRVIETEYAEVTPAGAMRHARFVRFRDDKWPEEADNGAS